MNRFPWWRLFVGLSSLAYRQILALQDGPFALFPLPQGEGE